MNRIQAVFRLCVLGAGSLLAVGCATLTMGFGEWVSERQNFAYQERKVLEEVPGLIQEGRTGRATEYLRGLKYTAERFDAKRRYLSVVRQLRDEVHEAVPEASLPADLRSSIPLSDIVFGLMGARPLSSGDREKELGRLAEDVRLCPALRAFIELAVINGQLGRSDVRFIEERLGRELGFSEEFFAEWERVHAPAKREPSTHCE